MRKNIINSFKFVYFCDLCGKIIDVVEEDGYRGYSDSNSRISSKLPYNENLKMDGENIDFHPKCFNDKLRSILLKQVKNEYGYVVGFKDNKGNIIRTFEPTIYYEGEDIPNHRCFDCNKYLRYRDVEKHSLDEGFTAKEVANLWKSKKVRFYCCSCYKKQEVEREIIIQNEIL